MSVGTGRQNIIVLFWESQFHFWENLNGFSPALHLLCTIVTTVQCSTSGPLWVLDPCKCTPFLLFLCRINIPLFCFLCTFSSKIHASFILFLHSLLETVKFFNISVLEQFNCVHPYLFKNQTTVMCWK